MSVTVDERAAAELRRRLADELEETGDLRSPQWRKAVEAVPRHPFTCSFFRRIVGPGQTLWEPITAASAGVGTWLKLVYANETWVTQLDNRVLPGDVTEPAPGVPTSSSTLPGLVVRMLEWLDIRDGHNVLEIGAGSGYSAALLCHRLGEDRVTTIEVDTGVVARADAALEEVGYSPYLITGDGLVGYPLRAPYDRIIATCSVRHVPYTWVRQSSPGAVILATISGWLHAFGLVKLTVGADGTAEGTGLPGTISFMPARPHTPPEITGAIDARTAYHDSERRARYGLEILDATRPHGWASRFVAQLAAPGAQIASAQYADGPLITCLIDVDREAFATLTPAPNGGWTVRQGGPIGIWDDIEDAVMKWENAGSPAIEAFRIRVTRTEQVVWLDTDDGEARWALP